MKASIRPSKISGTVRAPASKSSMQRACAAALLSKHDSFIYNPGTSNDDKASLEVIRALGATAEFRGDDLVVTSKGVDPISDMVHCGESGLGIRMFTPIIAMSDREMIIEGEGSLLKRPMNFFEDFLSQLGVTVKTNNGKLPVHVKGPLIPANIEIDGSLSSQFLTGLLLAYSGSGASNVTISVKNLKSRPYINLTLDVMKQFGMRVPLNDQYEKFYFGDDHDVKGYHETHYTVEGDWSGGAFLLVAGAIAGPVTVRGLDMMSTQADKAITEALMDAQAEIAIEAKGIKVHPQTLKAFEFDATECPDLFPPLVALASYCKGTSRLTGIERLEHKESNRTLSLQQEFGKMGVKIETTGNIMLVHGGNKLNGAHVHSHHDHRIAMATAIAALGANGDTVIEDADAVNKSYPAFFTDLQKLGADVTLDKRTFIHE